MRYRHPGAKEAATRNLEPLGLVLKAGVWYLVARREGELRTYRLSRVEEVSLLEEQFERPDDFDLARFWQATVEHYEASVPTVEVVVRVSDAGYAWLCGLERQGGRSISERDGLDEPRARCTVAFENLEEAYDDLLQLGAEVEVIDPPSLRSRLATTAAAMVSLYQ